MSVRFIAEGNRFDFRTERHYRRGCCHLRYYRGCLHRDYETGASRRVLPSPIFEFPKAGSEFLQGEKVYWDSNQMTDTQPTTSDVPVGIVAQDAASGAATARILLVPGLTA